MFAFRLIKYSLDFDEIWYLEEVGDSMLKVVNNIYFGYYWSSGPLTLYGAKVER